MEDLVRWSIRRYCCQEIHLQDTTVMLCVVYVGFGKTVLWIEFVLIFSLNPAV